MSLAGRRLLVYKFLNSYDTPAEERVCLPEPSVPVGLAADESRETLELEL
jgi:hypothetical protein